MNRRYGTRNSNRFSNITNNFTPATDTAGGARTEAVHGGSNYNTYTIMPPAPAQPDHTYQQMFDDTSKMYPAQPATNVNADNLVQLKSEDVVMKEDTVEKPSWMKSRLAGVKKISNKERRRRQNENLRRLLSPKNALMVLNEMLPGEQVANQFKVDVAQPGNVYTNQQAPNFCADLVCEGHTYKGYGENKLSARNAAAEQAIRDLMLKKMARHLQSDAPPEEEEEALPMIQLASFALHKLFAEWEGEGHRVPTLRPAPAHAEGQQPPPSAEPAPPREKKPRVLPPAAELVHPCTLLTHMRPDTLYISAGVEGDKPQNMVFTMNAQVDNQTFSGRANSKKEARKNAAAAACTALFNVIYT